MFPDRPGGIDMLIRLKAFCGGALLLSSTLPGSAQLATYDRVLRNAALSMARRPSLLRGRCVQQQHRL
jgi:hypothetical protein